MGARAAAGDRPAGMAVVVEGAAIRGAAMETTPAAAAVCRAETVVAHRLLRASRRSGPTVVAPSSLVVARTGGA